MSTTALKKKLDKLEALGLLNKPNMGVTALLNCDLQAGTYKAALFKPGVDTSKRDRYDPNGEVQGQGYEVGGKPIVGMALVHGPIIIGGFFKNAVWKNATISADSAMIYDTSRNNIKVCTVEFGETVTSTNGDYHVIWMHGDDKTDD